MGVLCPHAVVLQKGRSLLGERFLALQLRFLLVYMANHVLTGSIPIAILEQDEVRFGEGGNASIQET